MRYRTLTSHCAGLVINAFLGPSGISRWSFELGVHQRIWWVDGGGLSSAELRLSEFLAPSAERRALVRTFIVEVVDAENPVLRCPSP